LGARRHRRRSRGDAQGFGAKTGEIDTGTHQISDLALAEGCSGGYRSLDRREKYIRAAGQTFVCCPG
jgi:hypothetical protein